MRESRRLTAWATMALMVVQSLLPSPVFAKDLIQTLFKLRKPVACSDFTVERLAKEIDWLEKHIDNYGSVVAKQPDVWGQARLTRHRQEVESQLFCKLNQFHLFINGTISRSDQTFLMDALTLSSAASSPAAATGLGANRRPAAPVSINNVIPSVQTPVANGSDGSAGSSSGNGGAQGSNGGGNGGGQGGNAGSAPNNQVHAFAGNSTPFPFTDFGGNFEAQAVALEPTVALDQLSNYLNHLNQLRRINEGDDTADSPGYSLNLVRIPVSVLPGRATRKGYGAEITFTVEPHLSESLLPTTFRSLIINDLVDQLGMPVTRLADQMSRKLGKLTKLIAELRRERQALADINRSLNRQADDTLRTLPSDVQKKIRPIAEDLASPPGPSKLSGGQGEFVRQFRSWGDEKAQLIERELQNEDIDVKYTGEVTKALNAKQNVGQNVAKMEATKPEELDARKRIDLLSKCIGDLQSDMTEAVTGPSARSRQSTNPIPPTQIFEVFGDDALKTIAREFAIRYTGPNVRWNGPPQFRVHPLDVHRFLQDELDGAYELLARDAAEPLWDEFINFAGTENCQNLADEIRGGHETVIRTARERFFKTIRGADGGKELSSVEALAWAIIVEAAVLNDRLIRDMRAVAEAKGCACMPEGDVAFYKSQPSPEAAEAFNRYVLCRWPVHVFALEPVTDDQNIADKYSSTREMQLALSLGFVTGKINANNMMQYARKLQTDMEAISLNRTAVAFSHGNDTFGWRFMPRFQSPPTPSNPRAFLQTLIGPSPNYDVCTRQIEPGMRECHAVIIMPSFVPFVTLDVRSNWFRLTHHHGWVPTHHHVEQSMADLTKLSRSIQAMHRESRFICDTDCYRPGEVERLMRRIRQLDRELPLQSMLVQVPVENTIGGYQMFSHGVTDLAPDLYGWYGGPGIILADRSVDQVPNCAADSGVPSKPAPNSKPAVAENARGAHSVANAPVSLENSMTDSKVTVCSYCGNDVTSVQTAGFSVSGNQASGDGSAANGKGAQSQSGNGKGSQPASDGSAPSTQRVIMLPPGTCDPPKTASCDQSRTTIFLVGNHFSVHQTMVIAGDKCIPDPILLSRQVMQVTIPRDVRPVLIDGEWFVDVHVATPYGVTSHLHIPVANSCGAYLPIDSEEEECDADPEPLPAPHGKADGALLRLSPAQSSARGSGKRKTQGGDVVEQGSARAFSASIRRASNSPAAAGTPMSSKPRNTKPRSARD